MIKADVTKKIGILKDDSVFLLNNVESDFHNKPIYKYMEKRKYEQAVSEGKKWRSLIQTVVGRNITVFLKETIR